MLQNGQTELKEPTIRTIAAFLRSGLFYTSPITFFLFYKVR